MIYVSVEHEVRRRPEIVWSVLSDLSSATAWVEGLVEIDADDGAAPGVGFSARIVRRDGSRRTAATCEVTAWRPCALVAVETRSGEMLFFDRVTLAPTPDGTHLAVNGEIVFGSRLAELFARPQGLLGAVRDPWAERVQGIYERSVEALVKRIETTTDRPYR